MADHKFRRQLAEVLDSWVTEDLIGPDQRDRLYAHYQLDTLSASASNRFATVLLSVGGILIGLGIIVFIAANWDVIPPVIRALAALGLMAGLQGLGLYLWQTKGRHRAATAFLFAGEMAMGASIGLMAQWFQVSGKPSGLFLAWSLGILAMAYGLRHAPTGALAIILWLIGFVSDQNGTPTWIYAPAVIPWITALVLFPLAYWCRSRWIFVCSSLGWFVALGTLAWELEAVNDYAWNENFETYFLSMPLLIGAIALWCWSFWHQRNVPWIQINLGPFQRIEGSGASTSVENSSRPLSLDPGLDFGPVAQFLSLLGLVVLFYCWSFNDVWQLQFDRSVTTLGSALRAFWLNPSAITISVWILAIGTAVLWGDRIRNSLVPIEASSEQQAATLRTLRLSDRIIGISALSLLILMHSGAWWGLSLLLTNLGLFVLGGAITWQGLQLSQRWRFWLGLLTITIHIITRFFEYETGLLVKSLVLIVCGIGVILAGLKFEQTRQA
ncbi:MAG: DUF2157 domain-containing protein [Cyanobacteria bacterium P01_F01_bin.150]